MRSQSIYKFIATLVVCAFSLLGSQGSAQAQGAAMSKDYWVTYLPSIKPAAPIWLLMCTNVDKTTIKVQYSEDTSISEYFTISPNKPMEYAVKADPNHVGSLLGKPTRPETIQKRSLHITASNPISLQGFTDADNNVGLFLVLPTSSLGQKYVISAFNDQPEVAGGSHNTGGGWIPNAFDSTAGGFVIVAIEDQTTVDIWPNGPTRTGRKRGEEWSVTLNKGETYWVQGASADETDDLSQSRVTSSKPIAVVAGCEIMRAWDAMVLNGHFDYNDYVVEQMIPVEVWGTHYISAPFTNKRGTALDAVGDLYRVYAYEPTTITFNGRVMPKATYWEFPQTTETVEITSEKPVMVVQYDYYFDFHEANRPRTSNSEMVLVPHHNWRKNATFKVPTGYALTYFAVAAHKDSIDKITVKLGGGAKTPIRGLPPGLKYTIGDYAIRIVQLSAPKQAIIEGDCDFAVYNYGTRDNDAIKATYGYASAAAASFGSLSFSRPPHMVVDSTCTTFNLTAFSPDADGRGIGEMYLLYDKDGLVYRNTPYVSNNVSLTIDPYSVGADTVRAHVTVNNPLLDAFAALYVTTRAGKDTVFTFTYRAPSIAVTPDTVSLLRVLYGTDSCSQITIKNTGTGNMTINGLSTYMKEHGKPTDFTFNYAGSFPVTLKPKETLSVSVCYKPSDLDKLHSDTLMVETGCFKAAASVVLGSGAIPIVVAEDFDYKTVDIGAKVCEPILIQNWSPIKNLVLTKDILQNSTTFTIDPSDLARMPITLTPKGTTGDHTTINVCFSPDKEGLDSTIVTWGRDIPPPYEDTIKPWSKLIGRAVAPSLHWDRSAADLAVTCNDNDTVLANLKNTGDATVEIKNIYIDGPDAAEFTILSVGSQSMPYNFPIDKGATMPVNIRFAPVTTGSNPWHTRVATLHADEVRGGKDTTINVDLGVTMTHPDIVVDKSSANLGEVDLNTPVQQTYTITNNGTAPSIIKAITMSDNTHFTVISGPKVGDTIQPGQSVQVVLQAMSSEIGIFSSTYELVDASSCAALISTATTMEVNLKEVTATGADYGTIWQCEARPQFVTFTNKGSQPITLYSAIINDATYQGNTAQNIDWFAFDDPGPLAQLAGNDTVMYKGSGRTVQPGETVQIPVVYIPAATGSARATVTFAYDSAGVLKELQRPLTGAAKILPLTVSTQPGAASTYKNYVDEVFTVPVSVKENLGNSDIYGYDFYLDLPVDMFNVVDVTTGDALPLQVNDAVRLDAQTTRIHVRALGTTMMTDAMHTLANVKLQTRLTKQLATPVKLVNDTINFLRQDGSPVCWTPTATLKADYEQLYVCGQGTIHDYLMNGSDGIVGLLKVGPNPTNAKSTVEYNVNENKTTVTAEVFSSLGNKVLDLLPPTTVDKGAKKLTFDASKLASGVYTVRIIGTSASGTRVISRQVTVEK